jgi:peptide/nickel transport system permease protein
MTDTVDTRHAQQPDAPPSWPSCAVLAQRFLRNPLGVVGLAITVAAGPVRDLRRWICAHDPLSAPTCRPAQPRLGAEFWFGADELGRDIYSRLVYGSRLTLLIVGAGHRHLRALGLLIGTVAGTYGGWTDRIFMRITDVFLAFPKLLLALAFVAALGPGIENAALAITLTAWPPYARLARAEALTVRNSDYVSAMRLQGAPSCGSSWAMSCRCACPRSSCA